MNKSDLIIQIGTGSIIQHGKQNNRIYLMKLNIMDTDRILNEITKLAAKYNYSKLFCKIPAQVAPLFFARGYILEGYVPAFYNGKEDAFFISNFLDRERQLKTSDSKLKEFYNLLQKEKKRNDYSPNDNYTIRKLERNDIPMMAKIYRETFESYPFPIQDPRYIAETMINHVQYFGAFKEGELAAIASSEIDFNGKNAEMTDFATRKTHTGQHLSCLLLETMEHEMKKQGIVTLYTIARLNSIPMNKTFIRFDFNYSGTLINNTNIAGKIESMNLYYKHI